MDLVTRDYCLDCEWAVSSRDHSQPEMTAELIEHAAETGHTVAWETQPTDPREAVRRFVE